MACAATGNGLQVNSGEKDSFILSICNQSTMHIPCKHINRSKYIRTSKRRPFEGT